jgi:hypothetical protein
MNTAPEQKVLGLKAAIEATKNWVSTPGVQCCDYWLAPSGQP